MDQAKFDRLPKWAQELITQQRRVIEMHREHIEQLSNSYISDERKTLLPTRVKMEGLAMDDPDIPLPDDAEIEFTVTPRNRVSVTLRKSTFSSGSVLKIMGNGCDPLLLKMHASNSLEIVFDDKRQL
jgi:spore coat protein CotH